MTYIEIYNGTGTTKNLSNYKIKVYNNTADSCTALFTNENLFKNDAASNWFTQPDKLMNVSSIGIMSLFKNNDVKKPDLRLR